MKIEMKSVATAVAGMMFILGFALVSSARSSLPKAVHQSLKPSVNMLIETPAS